MDDPTFTLFPSLPWELRLLIWTLTLPPSRRIDLDPSKIPKHPLTLFINRESRSLTLQHYEWVPVLRCYIDFSIDLINYSRLPSFRDLSLRIENIVFSFTNLDCPSFAHYICGQLRSLDVESFPGLRGVLVVGHYFWYTEVWGPTQAQEGKPTRTRVDDSLEGIREIAEEKLQEVRKGKGYAMDEVASQAPNISFEVCEKCFKNFEEDVPGMGCVRRA